MSTNCNTRRQLSNDQVTNKRSKLSNLKCTLYTHKFQFSKLRSVTHTQLQPQSKSKSTVKATKFLFSQ